MKNILLALLICTSSAIRLRLSSTPCHPANKDQHIVFSTGCDAFQHWQAETMLNSAFHEGQCGKITRIVVGCDKRVEASSLSTHPQGSGDDLISLQNLHKSTFPGLQVHIAPSVPEAAQFPWMNKPYSFVHWLNSTSPKETAITILDPDEFFLQPLTQYRNKSNANFQILSHHKPPDNTQVTDKVQPGVAVAQLYGFETGYLHTYDKSKVCPGGATSPCAKVTEAEAAHNFRAPGPPYIMHNTDFRKMMPTWWENMKTLYPLTPGDLLTDMYAYTFAAIHEGVKHVPLENFMVSNSRAGGEAWQFVDDLTSMSCQNPVLPDDKPRPSFLHAAGHYSFCSKGDTRGEDGHVPCSNPASQYWNFHKGHVPATILNCDEPLLMPPPDDAFNNQVMQGNLHGKREAFMVCQFTYLVNRAALDYKKKFCGASFNQKKCTRIVTNDPMAVPYQKGDLKNPRGYPLAKIDMECMN